MIQVTAFMADLSERIAQTHARAAGGACEAAEDNRQCAGRADAPSRSRSSASAAVSRAARSPEAFWRLLSDGVDAVTEVPRERWDVDALFDPDPAAAGQDRRRAGAASSTARPVRSRTSSASRRARPRAWTRSSGCCSRWRWEALEDAGQTLERLAGSQTGVFVGLHSHSSDYCLAADGRPGADRRATPAPATAHSIAARPALLSVRPAGTEPRRRHRLLVVAGGGPPGLPEPALRRVVDWRWPAASTCC